MVSKNDLRKRFSCDFVYQKRLSKLEGDILLMSSFPPEFLRVQEEVRQEMMLGPNICSEDLINIKFKPKTFEPDEEFLSKVNEILQISQNMIKNSKEKLQLAREVCFLLYSNYYRSLILK